MGKRKMHLRSLMDEKPRLGYKDLADATNRKMVTVARWMQDEPTHEQFIILEDAIRRIRKGDTNGQAV